MGVEYEGDLTPELVDYIKNNLSVSLCRICGNKLQLTYIKKEEKSNVAQGRLNCGSCEKDFLALIGLKFE